MKKYLTLYLVPCTLYLFTLLPFALFAQTNGVINYNISHNWTKKIESSKTMSKTEKERMAYVWGNQKEYVIKATLKFDVNKYRFEYNADEENNAWRKEEYIVYRDREKNETFDVLNIIDKPFVIQDSIVCQSWKIKNNLKEVAGRICMNATYYDTVKEKEVEAWFALDLPIPLGPDKYCGLPGMILEINEANGAVIYTATTILLSDESMNIEKPVVKKNRKIISLRDYNQKIIAYINESKKSQRPYFWGIAF